LIFEIVGTWRDGPSGGVRFYLYWVIHDFAGQMHALLDPQRQDEGEPTGKC
jgi:hypothetical protein